MHATDLTKDIIMIIMIIIQNFNCLCNQCFVFLEVVCFVLLWQEEEGEEEGESNMDSLAESGDGDGEKSSPRVTVTTGMVKEWSKKLKEVIRVML